MNASLKSQASQLINTLTEEKVKVVVSFMEFLEEKERWEATREILANPQMVKEIKEADMAWRENRMEEFIPWDKVKRNV